MPIEIAVNGWVIRDCESKLVDFIVNGPYSAECRAIAAGPDPNVISREQVRLLNAARRGRAPVRALRPFLDTPLPELAAIPTEADLIESSDLDVDLALECAAALLFRLCVPLVKDTTATRLLHLKRPRLIPVSDAHTRRALGVDARLAPAARATSVARGLRELGRRNAEALAQLKVYADSTTKVVRDAVPLSKASLLDILLWVEEARRGADPFWSRRYPV